MIIIVGCFAQCLAGDAPAVNALAVIIVWRFIVSWGFYLRLLLPDPPLCRWVSELAVTTL